VLATDAFNQDGEVCGIFAGKSAPLDIADKILHTAAALQVDYNSKVSDALRAGTVHVNKVWVFQSPNSVEIGEWILFHATSLKESKFKEVTLFPTTLQATGDQNRTTQQ